jgi:hypothetical protein
MSGDESSHIANDIIVMCLTRRCHIQRSWCGVVWCGVEWSGLVRCAPVQLAVNALHNHRHNNAAVGALLQTQLAQLPVCPTTAALIRQQLR